MGPELCSSGQGIPGRNPLILWEDESITQNQELRNKKLKSDSDKNNELLQ